MGLSIVGPTGPAATTMSWVDRFGVLEIVDDALVLSFPTSTDPIVLTAEDFDGDLGAVLDPPRNITITTTASPGTYVTTDWTIESTALDGSSISETRALTETGGGETVSGAKVHAAFDSISIPPMNDTNGTIKIGVGGKVGLRHKAFYTDASEQPYATPTFDGQAVAVTPISKSAAGCAPYGAFDFTGTLDGMSEAGAMYTRDLS